jgi:O-antigen biosynthesis protein
LKKYLFGTTIGTGIILMFYALFPKEWQFSRLYILVGAGWVFSYYLLSRILLHFSIGKRFTINGQKHTNFAVVGSADEFERVSAILKQTQPKIEKIVQVSTEQQKDETAVGTIEQLDQVAAIHSIDEIIFCAKDTSAQTIIEWMTTIRKTHIDYKIAQPDSLFLIGSNSIETAGDLYILNINAISHPSKQRQKRILDFFAGSLMLLLFPLIYWFYTNKLQFFKNALQLISGKKTLVSYASGNKSTNKDLPSLKSGILTPHDHLELIDEQLIVKLDLLYAREYHLLSDLRIVLRSWKKLDHSK